MEAAALGFCAMVARMIAVSRAHRTSIIGALLAASAGCAGAPRLPPVAVKLDTPPPVAATPPPLPARWVESAGATIVGPRTSRGTLLLLGGRRALLLADGALEIEKTPAPEPLAEVIAVPSRGALALIGRGAHGVYRFDDPLGPAVTLARSEARIGRLGAGPGSIAVWVDRSDLPRFIDVQTGAERPWSGLPDPPLVALAFVDDKRGAAIFEVVGLAVTTDGGASWRPSPGPAPRDALSVTGLRRRDDKLHAFAFGEGPDAPVDLDKARLGVMDAQPNAASDAPILRWLRATSRDPLEALASSGVDLPEGGALMAAQGLLARVDPRSGKVSEIVELSRGKWAPCNAARAGAAVWVACGLTDIEGTNLFDPFGVMRLPAEARLTPERPSLVRNGEADLRVSPSGGVMLAAACRSEDTGQACVRQPDGRWLSIDTSAELGERGAGPLADGRVAFLRGIFDGDDAPEAGPEDEADPARPKRLHVATLGAGGKERALAAIPLTSSRGYVRVQSPIEEEADHSLHFVIEDGEGPHAVIVPPGREAPTVVRIPDATEARLRAGRGLAVGEGHVLASLDGGASWNEVPVTPAALEAARAVAAGVEDADRFAVSEAGARVGGVLRLGWGPAESSPVPPDPAPPGGIALGLPQAPSLGPERTLRCAAQAGAATGLPPLTGLAEARQLLVGKTEVVKTKKREPGVWASRISSMETVALVEESAPDNKPSTWVFRWHDPREIGGKVQRATVKPPGGASGSQSLRFAASRGGRALFVMRSAGKTWLVRVKAGGGSEIVDVPQELVPAGAPVFGAERGEPIAWIQDTRVVVWVAGERPRAIAEIGTHAARVLGTPTSAGVPLLISGVDWALYRTLPIPQLAHPAAGPRAGVDKASPDKAPPAAAVSLDGWTRILPLRHAAASLAPCGPRPKGARFTLERPGLRAEVDGVSETASTALYDVRIDGAAACVEGLSALLVTGRRTTGKAPSPPAVKGQRPPPPAGVGAAFVRVDLAGGRAEGGARGLAPDAAVRRLDCKLASP